MRTVTDISQLKDNRVKIYVGLTIDEKNMIMAGIPFEPTYLFDGDVTEIAGQTHHQAAQTVHDLFKDSHTWEETKDMIRIGDDMYGILDGITQFVGSVLTV